MRRIAFTLTLFGTSAAAIAGPYTEAGLASTDTRFVGWATGFQNLVRGPQNIAAPGGSLATVGTGDSALGVPNGSDVVSLGDGGQITLTFARPIVNGPGADFAVFENGFVSGNGLFAELGFVEVSSNGVDFARFPSVSLTPTSTQIGGFGTIDPTNVYNLAGKHASRSGTPFDLSSLTTTPAGFDANDVRFVRIVDVVGSIDPLYARYDSLGNAINDPYATPFASGGFDLDAIGAINVPEPASLALLAAALPLVRRRRRH